MDWQQTFIYQGKKLPYNRIEFNNSAERVIEVPIAFNFLANLKSKNNILEVGNVLSYYENSLSEYLGIKPRKIIDKFEPAPGIENLDLMELPSQEKYDAIVSISTAEHIGQGVAPTGTFGETIQIRDLEAPLKAIAKIYDLLELNGRALVTVPFGKLLDGEWYIQFSQEYLNLLTAKYGVPAKAVSTTFLKKITMEPTLENPYQLWVEASAEELQDVEYHWPWDCSNAIAFIELTKLPTEFVLNLEQPASPLQYSQPLASSLEPEFRLATQKLLGELQNLNFILFPNWMAAEESVASELKTVFEKLIYQDFRTATTLLVHTPNNTQEKAKKLLENIAIEFKLNESFNSEKLLKICLVEDLNELQWKAILPLINYRICLSNENLEYFTKNLIQNISKCYSQELNNIKSA